MTYVKLINHFQKNITTKTRRNTMSSLGEIKSNYSVPLFEKEGLGEIF